MVFHDSSERPTTNPAMGPTDPTREEGVGVQNNKRKWEGLVHYNLQMAPAVLDANNNVDYPALSFFDVFTDLRPPLDTDIDPIFGAGDPLDVLRIPGVCAPEDTCWRVKVKLGKLPESMLTPTSDCQLGKCGDKGYEIASNDPMTITCVGSGPLASTKIEGTATRHGGRVTVRWTTTNEVGITGFKLLAVSAKGSTQIGTVSCTQCTNGLGDAYSRTFSAATLKGARKISIETLGTTKAKVEVPVR